MDISLILDFNFLLRCLHTFAIQYVRKPTSDNDFLLQKIPLVTIY